VRHGSPPELRGHLHPIVRYDVIAGTNELVKGLIRRDQSHDVRPVVRELFDLNELVTVIRAPILLALQ
jgi:hypothetical protein